MYSIIRRLHHQTRETPGRAPDNGYKKPGLAGFLKRYGVDDGTRTHDNRNHNPGLYQLSYIHRRKAEYD